MRTAASLETVKFGVKVTAEAFTWEQMLTVRAAARVTAIFFRKFIYINYAPMDGDIRDKLLSKNYTSLL